MRTTLIVMLAILALACGDESSVSSRPGPPLIPIEIEDHTAYSLENLKELYPLRQRHMMSGQLDRVVPDPDADVDTSINGAIDLFISRMFWDNIERKEMSPIESRQSVLDLIIAATKLAAEDVEPDVDRALGRYGPLFEDARTEEDSESECPGDVSFKGEPKAIAKPQWIRNRGALLMDAEAHHFTDRDARHRTSVRLRVWRGIRFFDDSGPKYDPTCRRTFGIATLYNSWFIDRIVSFCVQAHGYHEASTDETDIGQVRSVSRVYCSTVGPNGEDCDDDSPECEVSN